MKKTIPVVCTLALILVAERSGATGPPLSSAIRLCADKLQNETLLYVNAVQKQIRLSIKNNLNAKDSKCAGGNVCAGGGNNNAKCDPTNGNGDCPSGECTVQVTKGVAGAINKSKGKLRSKILQSCTDSDLSNLGFPNERCPDPDSPTNGLDRDELGDCILGGAIGDIDNAIFGDPAGEILGRAAGGNVPDSPAPIKVCGVTLGNVLQIGSESADATIGEAGAPTPQTITGCTGGVCDTRGSGVVGNTLAITQTFAGLIAICLWTKTTDADPGPGTATAIGSINLNNGSQSTFTPIETTVLIGTTCPVCTSGLCDSGPNGGQPCNAAGSTDPACPPTVAGVPPVIPNPLNLDTADQTIAVPPNSPGGGSTNPAGTFCGACDLDETQGCSNDQDCIDKGACSGGVGSACCGFGTNTGAFGDDQATTTAAIGVTGPLLPRLATLFCTGKSGSGLVDSTQGLPGPVRLVQQQLNAFEYPP